MSRTSINLTRFDTLATACSRVLKQRKILADCCQVALCWEFLRAADCGMHIAKYTAEKEMKKYSQP